MWIAKEGETGKRHSEGRYMRNDLAGEGVRLLAEVGTNGLALGRWSERGREENINTPRMKLTSLLSRLQLQEQG